MGLQTNSPSILPTLTPATGPAKGILDVISADEAAVIDKTSGSFS